MKPLALVLVLLVACTPRGTITMDPRAGDVGDVRSVFVGTTRAVDPATGTFGGERTETAAFARYDVSVPPDRAPGEINWPPRRGPADPATDFLTTAAIVHPDARTFRADLARALAQEGVGERDAVVFVHGFNNTYSEGLYRIAQLAHDLDLPGAVVHYSWPSAGNPLGYVYDADSALFARDGLEVLLNQVADAGAKRIFLVAHSMGSALTMETLRQIAIRNDKALMARIGGVILISPDLDVDVFHAQATMIGKLPDPFLIFGSNRDRILQLSAGLTGKTERLGNLSEIARLADLKVTFMEVGAFSSGAGHFTAATSPALLQLLGRMVEVNAAFVSDQKGRTDLLSGAVLTVQNATEIILLPVTAIAGEIAN
ncbi:alpha/beta fold hydrolase [Paracoccaceae bacterium Fryx2]|nr:alpha/beta fold hydrolase [Paracoccaceae bacterium Fryx2]